MPAHNLNSSNVPAPSTTADAGTVRLLQAMGLSAVRVSPGIVALTSKPAQR